VSIPGALTAAALMIGTVVTLVLGVAPASLLDLTTRAADFVR
jgi:NADH-quinone oxidoreductase subunit N